MRTLGDIRSRDVWMCYGGWICTNIPGDDSSQNVSQSKVGDLVFLCESLEIIDEIGCESDQR